MKQSYFKSVLAVISLGVLVSFGFNNIAGAIAKPEQNLAPKLSIIKTTGDQEISSRQATLGKLSLKIEALKKVSATNKSMLSSQVASTAADLTSLQTKLDADTDVPTAIADRQSIITNFRVYLLVIPKVHLVKIADDEQAKVAALTNFAAAAQKHVTSTNSSLLQPKLSDLKNNVQLASTTINADEPKILALTPSDYNSDHQTMTNYLAALTQANAQLTAATADAKFIVANVK